MRWNVALPGGRRREVEEMMIECTLLVTFSFLSSLNDDDADASGTL